MNKKRPRFTEKKISEMCSGLSDQSLSCVEPQGDDSLPLSADRIKRLALSKREEYLQGNEEKPMKKVPVKIILAAAVLCALSLTAFAAFGGLDYFRSKFGDSVDSIAQDVRTPDVRVEGGGRTMALEAIVTDGYITEMVVSLTGGGLDGGEEFRLSGNGPSFSTGWHEMEAFSTSDKTFYSMALTGEARFEEAEITVDLQSETAPLSLRFQARNTLGNKVIAFDEGDFPEAAHAIRELQITPMGFLAIAREKEVKGSLPSLHVALEFEDGTVEYLDVEFDDGEETVMGGGGVILAGPGETAPLVVSFGGRRNPDGEMITHGQFSRIINPDRIQKITVESKEFPV